MNSKMNRIRAIEAAFNRLRETVRQNVPAKEKVPDSKMNWTYLDKALSMIETAEASCLEALERTRIDNPSRETEPRWPGDPIPPGVL